ncbi:MAG TPA: deoxyhypusine synthase [Methanomicrobiales archaeon]|nr:deoxyhypusine synthase [Methanomicrobiales archaeon]
MEQSEPVRQVQVWSGMTAGQLLEQLGGAGAFNAGALYRASCIYEEMLRDEEATRFFGLAGAMVPGGMGGIVSSLIEKGYIDVLVSTGANLVHDIVEAIGCHHIRDVTYGSDVELRHRDISRIYDVYLPNDAFCTFEEFMQGVFSELTPETPVSISGLLRHIGEHLNSGILATAAEKEIPVFCPAIQDSMIGLQYWLFHETRPVTVDAFLDMKEIIDRCFAAKRAGVLIVGGGVPKNYILQSMLLTPRGFDYAVQLTGDRPDLGGLSGATLDEARSWGKLEESARSATVYGDATITLPLMVAAVLERISR